MNREFAVAVIYSVIGFIPYYLHAEQNHPQITFNREAGKPPLYRSGESAEFRIRMPRIKDADETFVVSLLDDRGKRVLREAPDLKWKRSCRERLRHRISWSSGKLQRADSTGRFLRITG